MPTHRRTLQSQGVPVPDRLHMTSRRHVVQQKQPLNGQMGGTQTTTTTYEARQPQRRSNRRRNARNYTPTRLADQSTAGIGLLEAEFFIAIGVLILIMFANSSASYGDRIMSTMKRGALTCLLFFLLAMIASIGTNAARIAKAFGALVIVLLILSSDINTILTDITKLIENDWVGTTESGPAPSSSADSGTSSATSASASAIAEAEQELQQMLSDASGDIKEPSNIGGVIPSAVKNAFQQTVNGIIPGLGDVLSKLGL